MKMIRLFATILCLAGVAQTFAAMSPAEIAAGLKSHDRALHVLDGFMRDPYMVLGPDGYYYLTGTTGGIPEGYDILNVGLKPKLIDPWKMRVWRSRDLANWEFYGTPYSQKENFWASCEEMPDSTDKKSKKRAAGAYGSPKEMFEKIPEDECRLWAPELHLIGGRWVIIHTTPNPLGGFGNMAVSRGDKLEGPFTAPMGMAMYNKHDCSLFEDDDGSLWLTWGYKNIAPIKRDLSGFAAEPATIEPANRHIGHEGTLIKKFGKKYVLFGTGWSTDNKRQGTHNLYYCTADNITGPYSDRRLCGRFLGHGFPFKDKEGKWWCTAFYNGNIPPISREDLKKGTLPEEAYTINRMGTTIVPLKVEIAEDGDVFIRAVDPDYAVPGPDEAQKF